MASHQPRARFSSGLSSLDDLLGGGLFAGTTSLLVAHAGTEHGKGATQAAVELLRCSAGEGAACGHPILWLSGRMMVAMEGSESDDERRDQVDFEMAGRIVPRVLDRGSSSSSKRTCADDVDKEHTSSSENPSSDLRIAWQYKRYIDAQRSLDDRNGGSLGGTISKHPPGQTGNQRRAMGGVSGLQWQPFQQRKSPSFRDSKLDKRNVISANEDIVGVETLRKKSHALDMTRSIGFDAAKALPAVFKGNIQGPQAAQRVVEHVERFIEQWRASQSPNHATFLSRSMPRILLDCPGGIYDGEMCEGSSNYACIERQWIMAISKISGIIREYGGICIVLLRASDWSQSGIFRVAHISRYVVNIYAKGPSAQVIQQSGADPERCLGFISVGRAMNAFGTARVIQSPLHALHRKRRRLAIDKLQPPPVSDVPSCSETNVGMSNDF